MGMHHAENGQPAIRLPNDAAGQRLGIAVETNVGDTGVAFGAGRQRGQDHRLVRLAQPEQYPARLLLAARLGAMAGKLLEQRATDTIRQQHALQRRVGDEGRCWRSGRRRRRARPVPRTLKIVEQPSRPAYQNLQHVPRPLHKDGCGGRSRPASARESFGTGLRWRANRTTVPPPFLPIIITSRHGRVKRGTARRMGEGSIV